MKTRYIYIIVLLIISCFMATCSKISQETLSTRLFLTLTDSAGKSVGGATVRLYKNAADTGIIKLSDSTGVVIFSNLQPTLYYWLAEKGCETNRNSQTTLNRNLISTAVLYGYSILFETGTLKIVNTSLEPYKVSDSLFSVTLNKDTTTYIAYPNVGAYKIHSEKVSTPGAGKDTLVQINCGDTSQITLPY